jgi:manganese/zinc/iron transport system permease protein
VISSEAARMPTGPTIVLCLTAVVVLSLTAAPRRGLVWRAVRERQRAARLRVGGVLADLHALANQHGDSIEHGHSAAVLRVMRPGGGVDASLAELERRGWARQLDGEEWALTDAGHEEAERREEERS